MFDFSPSAFREPAVDERQWTAAVPSRSPSLLRLAIGAATLPLLSGIVASRWLGAGLGQLGSASEELFRGDRLPLLKDLPRDPSEPGHGE